MLAVICTTPVLKQSAVSKLFHRLFPSGPGISHVQTDCGCFDIINCEVETSAPKLDGLLSWVKDSYSSILLPKKCTVEHPERYPLIDTVAYRRRVLMGYAKRIAGRAPLSPTSLRVAIVDPDAQSGDLALEFTQAASTVKILTDRPQIFTDLKSRVPAGSTLQVTDHPGSILDAHLILAPFGINAPLLTNPRSVAFAVGEVHPGVSCTVIDGFELRLPVHLLRLLPAGADEIDFAAALYQELKMESVLGLPPVFLQSRGKRLDHENLKSCLITLDSAV